MTLTDQDRALKLELRNTAIRRAHRNGSLYGLGIACTFSITLAHFWTDNWGWLIPTVIAGITIPAFLADVLVRLESRAWDGHDR